MSRFLARELAAADFAITVCQHNKGLMCAREPRSAGKIQVIRPFLSAELLRKPPRACANADPPLRLLSVSRLVPKKGAHVLVEAVRKLRSRGIAVRAKIVGEGRERPRLEAVIAALDVGAHVALVGAKQPKAVHTLLDGADCFVIASVPAPDGDADAAPTVLGEAMAKGLPVISTRLNGIPEIVPEGAGLLVAPGDAGALADAIAEIASMSAEQRRAMGARGRQFVQEHWNGDKDVHRLIALFRSVVRPIAT